jgi:uncharacterized protein (TIGR00297 family)
MNILTLDWKGALLGLGIALALLILGGSNFGVFFVLTLLYFLVASAIVTYIGKETKVDFHLYQKSRGIRNVIANGLPGLIFAVLFFVLAPHGLAFERLAVLGFVASVAAVTADKFSSELGVLDGVPKSIISLKPVKKGVSGGVTLLGTAAGLAGAMIISLALIPIPLMDPALGLNLAASGIIVIIAGLAGSVVDSFLGYYEEKGLGNKYTTNFACGLIGGIIAIILYVLFV